MEDHFLTKRERRKQRKQRELAERKRQERRKRIKRQILSAGGILIVGGGVWGFIWLSRNIPTFPPTNIEGHIEAVPESHILSEPMPENIQKHMLEHADGSGPPGVIIHYNCVAFACEEDLVEKLKQFVDRYPENVYLAPGPRYDGKIILTKYRNREVLEEFDEERIEAFILQ